MPEVEIFVHEIHVWDLHIFKEQRFEEKNYFVPIMKHEAQIG